MIRGLVAGVFWALDTVLLSLFMEPWQAFLFVPLLATGLHDLCSCLFTTVHLAFRRELKGAWKSLHTGSARWIAAGALLGGPVGMLSYVLAIRFIGAGYTAVVSCMYPALGVLLSCFLYKEKLRPSQIFGLVLCLGGVAVLSFSASDTTAAGESFHLGLLAGMLCVLAWALEGIIAQQGMKKEVITSDQALWIRQSVSACLFVLVIFPLVNDWSLAAGLVQSSGFWILSLSALAGTASYLFYYSAIHKIGASRAMPLNITYTAWAIFFSALLGTPAGWLEILLAAVIVGGSILASR